MSMKNMFAIILFLLDAPVITFAAERSMSCPSKESDRSALTAALHVPPSLRSHHEQVKRYYEQCYEDGDGSKEACSCLAALLQHVDPNGAKAALALAKIEK